MKADLGSDAVYLFGCDDLLSLNSSSLFLPQEKMIDLESDLEELHDSEQRWAAKHKRAIEQVDTLETGSDLTEAILSLTGFLRR